MNTRGEKSLATRAHQQIGICCETLCEKDVVIDYIKELESEVERLNKLNNVYAKLHAKLVHEYPEKSGSFFICGGLGSQDSFGVPDRILICPQYGADGFYVYKKEKDYSAPEW